MNELKPCPFCGSDKPSIRTEHDLDGCVWHYVRCSNCGARTSGKWVSHASDTCPAYYAEVRAEWNSRAIPQTHRIVSVELLREAMHASYLSNPDLHERLAGIIDNKPERA